MSIEISVSDSELKWLEGRRRKLNAMRAKYKARGLAEQKPNVALSGPPKPHEVCVLLRRRKGLTQKEVAEKLGCTRLWVVQMEAGDAPIDRLGMFWGL